MESKTALNLIEVAAKAIFPKILPSRLQEAREAILTHLNLTREDFGFFPSGGSKFENFCSQVVRKLKNNKEMTTDGWVWIWAQSQKTPDDLPHVLDLSLATPDLDFEGEGLYLLEDEETLTRIIAVTACFSHVVEKDEECVGCPLRTLCVEKKEEVRSARRLVKEQKFKALSKATEAGYNLKGVKIPKSARISDAEEVVCKESVLCVVSSEKIELGELAYHIPSWGMLKKVIGDSYIEMQKELSK